MQAPRFFLLCCFSVVSAQTLAVASVIPASYPMDRYAPMLEESPFALATPQEAPEAPPAPGFALNLVLTGLVPEKDPQGGILYSATVKDRSETTSFMLSGTQERNGISIASVDWSPANGKHTVTLKKGNEFGIIKFDPMQVHSAPPVTALPGQSGARIPGPAGINPQNGGVRGGRPQLPVRGVPGQSVNQPNQSRIQIPRPNVPMPQAGVNPGAPGPQPAVAPQPPPRRSVRVITRTPQ